MLECPLQDLGVHLDDFDLRRPPGYAYEPLQQALAAKCGVPPDCMVTAMGDLVCESSGNGLLLSPGDEVLIEHPTYDPMVSVANYLVAPSSGDFIVGRRTISASTRTRCGSLQSRGPA